MTSITVHNSKELSAALTKLSATGGTILVVNDGSDYAISRTGIGNTKSPITITAADPKNPPNFTDVELFSSKNIDFKGLMFDTSHQTVSNSDKVLSLYNSTDISFTNNTFLGASNGFIDGSGSAAVGRNLGTIRNSDDVVFSNNKVSNMGFGISVVDSDRMVIANNDFGHLTFDPLRLSGVQDMLIENNYFHDIFGSTQDVNHSDMIQVWSAPYNTQNTENLTIRGNFFDSGEGAATQTIFIRSEMGNIYKNIVIEDNTIYNGHAHGITVADTNGVTVSNNTLLWDQDAVMQNRPGSTPVSNAPKITLSNVTKGVVTDNIVSSISAGSAVQSGNYIINNTNPGADNYVGKLFVNALDSGAHDLRDLSLLPGTVLKGVGAAATQPGGETGLTAVMKQAALATDASTIVYDASLSHNGGKALNPVTTKYVWTLEDGRKVEGAVVKITYDTPGEHPVTLTITTANGKSSQIERISTVKPEVVLSIDFNGAVQDSSGYKTDLAIKSDAAKMVASDSFTLDGTRKLAINGSQIFDLQAFTMGLTLSLDSVKSVGTVLSMYSGLSASVMADGSVRVSINTLDGWVAVSSAAGLIADTAEHRIAFSFDGSGKGALVLFVDGAEVGKVAVTAPMVDTGGWSLVVGNSYGASLKGTVDDLLMLRSAKDVSWAAVDAGLTSPDLSKPGAGAAVLLPEPVVVLPEGLDAGLALATRLVDPSREVPLSSLADKLRFDFNGTFADTSGKAATVRATGAYQTTTGVSGDGFHLDGSSKLIVDRFNRYLHSPEELTLGVSLKLDEADDRGTFFSLHNGMSGSVMADGAVKIAIYAGGKWTAVQSAPGLVDDTDWHRIVVTYDGVRGGDGLQLYVDGHLVDAAAATGPINWGTGHSLVFGNSFGTSVQATLDDISLSGDAVGLKEITVDYESMIDRVAASAHPDQVGVKAIGNAIFGTHGADVIVGTAADELIFGREGGDTLTGGGGADSFIFDRIIDPAKTDLVTDFSSGTDHLLFDADLFGLKSNAFAGSSFVNGTEAAHADTRFVYDSNSGQLWFDADGSGQDEQQLILRLTPGTSLTGHDIILF